MTKKTAYELSQERACIFSQHFRALIESERFEEDTHGAHAEANRLTDLQLAGGGSTDPLASNLSSTGGGSANSSPAQKPAEYGDSWAEVLGTKCEKPAANHTSNDHRPGDTSLWDEVIAEHNAERQRHRR
ncbi:hypothetical protein [Devosia naphthalenivorans]|uniref:hypothetical protein n=1 Tax=Devosia naphthalenivorans TaxID=2082392 RepID=UPI000D3A2C25|nr:hypothetical protein [Devosia naphthalenivorans]